MHTFASAPKLFSSGRAALARIQRNPAKVLTSSLRNALGRTGRGGAADFRRARDCALSEARVTMRSRVGRKCAHADRRARNAWPRLLIADDRARRENGQYNESPPSARAHKKRVSRGLIALSRSVLSARGRQASWAASSVARSRAEPYRPVSRARRPFSLRFRNSDISILAGERAFGIARGGTCEHALCQDSRGRLTFGGRKREGGLALAFKLVRFSMSFDVVEILNVR